MAKTISENCSITITSVDAAKKFQALVGEFRSFIWFINIPSVYFLAERNWLFTTAEYLTCFGENESEERKKFRIHGLPNFLHLREIFVVRGLEFVDFEWIIMDLSGVDKKWMRASLYTT
ncbi:hypothetical protein C2S52_022066 [Perilla frutescens var. hirtella]|nr:hypothetical protein C2S52_022066 [Perilla frutescens var. hirtella]